MLIGGARSGKSRYAQEMAEKSGQVVLFVATAEAGDEEMRHRIAKHRQVRPKTWRTLEATRNIGRQLRRKIGQAQMVIIDCITLLVSNILTRYTDETGEPTAGAEVIEQEVTTEIDGLIETMNSVDASFIIVTNEVGEGLVPPNAIGRLYRDLLGRANQMLARQADEVYLMVAGLPLKVKPTEHSG
ncbi:MAG: bifunctional adenosylcobinamide kinase/adenosylcobinamide-phosphate guanylyltransferase [Chloroflexota bacterium]